MNPDAFDLLLVNQKPDRSRIDKDLVLNPEVARLFTLGYSARYIASVLGIPITTLNNYRYSAPMKVLMEREVRRILRHLPSRDLKRVPYDKLITSAGIVISKLNEIENAQVDEKQIASTELIQNISIAIFGASSIAGSASPGGQDRVVNSGEAAGILRELEPAAADIFQADVLGSEAGSVREQSGILRQVREDEGRTPVGETLDPGVSDKS
jgi:hypothetical protein